jgi:hypothetical protein
VADNLRRETEPFVVGCIGVCFHACTMSQDLFSGQANSQVDNTPQKHTYASCKKQVSTTKKTIVITWFQRPVVTIVWKR